MDSSVFIANLWYYPVSIIVIVEHYNEAWKSDMRDHNVLYKWQLLKCLGSHKVKWIKFFVNIINIKFLK